MKKIILIALISFPLSAFSSEKSSKSWFNSCLCLCSQDDDDDKVRRKNTKVNSDTNNSLVTENQKQNSSDKTNPVASLESVQRSFLAHNDNKNLNLTRETIAVVNRKEDNDDYVSDDQPKITLSCVETNNNQKDISVNKNKKNVIFVKNSFTSLMLAQRALFEHYENKNLNLTSKIIAAASHNKKEEEEDDDDDDDDDEMLQIFLLKLKLKEEEEQARIQAREQALLSDLKMALVEDNSALFKKVTECEDFALIPSKILSEISQGYPDSKYQRIIFSLIYQKEIKEKIELLEDMEEGERRFLKNMEENKRYFLKNMLKKENVTKKESLLFLLNRQEEILQAREQAREQARRQTLLSNLKMALVEDNSALFKKVTECKDFALIPSGILLEISQGYPDSKYQTIISSLIYQKEIKEKIELLEYIEEDERRFLKNMEENKRCFLKNMLKDENVTEKEFRLFLLKMQEKILQAREQERQQRLLLSDLKRALLEDNSALFKKVTECKDFALIPSGILLEISQGYPDSKYQTIISSLIYQKEIKEKIELLEYIEEDERGFLKSIEEDKRYFLKIMLKNENVTEKEFLFSPEEKLQIFLLERQEEMLQAREQARQQARQQTLLSNLKMALVEDNSALFKKVTECKDFALIPSKILSEISQGYPDSKYQTIISSLIYQKEIKEKIQRLKNMEEGERELLIREKDRESMVLYEQKAMLKRMLKLQNMVKCSCMLKNEE